MPPGFGPQTLSAFEMIAAVACFTAMTTPIAVLLWFGIRRVRKRPMRWSSAWCGIAVACVVVSGVDVSLGGNSGIFSIFALMVIPVYVGLVLLVVSVAAIAVW